MKTGGIGTTHGGRPNFERMERAYRIISERPGISVGELAEILDTSSGTTQSLVVTMENHGYMLSEGEAVALKRSGRGPRPRIGLYIFDRVRGGLFQGGE